MRNRYFSLQLISHQTRKHIARLLPVVATVLALFVLAAPLVHAQWGEIVLHSFCSQPNCTDGADPVAGLIFDAQGNLYGTTRFGGNAFREGDSAVQLHRWPGRGLSRCRPS